MPSAAAAAILPLDGVCPPVPLGSRLLAKGRLVQKQGPVLPVRGRRLERLSRLLGELRAFIRDFD
jgi:hypothetical protein